MKLTKKNETASTITFTVSEVPAGVEGFRYYSGGVRRSRTFDPTDREFTLSKVPSGEYACEAIGFTSLATAAWDETPEPGTARLVAEAVYEGYANVKDVPLWKTHGEQAKADDRMRVVDDPLGQRGKVMRVEVRSGDSAVAGSGQGERADVMASASAVPMREGSIVAVSCPIMLPTEFQSNNSGWNVPFGGHDASGGTQSPIQFEIRNSKDLRLRIFGGTASGGSGDFRRDFALASLAKNRWYHLVYANLFSWEPTKGRTVVLLDGVEVLDEPVANLYKGSYCYHKQGWYRVAQPYTTVLYFDSTRFWTAPTVEAAVGAALL